MTEQIQPNQPASKPHKTNLLAILILIAVLLGAIIIAGYYYFLPQNKENINASQPSAETNTNQLLGGDEDEYGCKGSAGYSWCESKEKCLRVWEEECPEATNANVSTNTNTSADETADWQIYMNDEYNFSIRYPNDWEKSDNKYSLVAFARPSTTQSYPSADDPLDAYSSISLKDNPNSLTLQELFNKDYADCKINPPAIGCSSASDVSKWTKLSVDGKEAWRSGKGNISGAILPADVLYIDLGNKFLSISGTYYNLNNTYDFAPVFEKILSTFQFND